jgi:tRNA modification GTPase
MNVLVPIEASLDFPDEEIGGVSGTGADGVAPGIPRVPHTSEAIQSSIDKIKQLLQSYDQGKILREGIATAIVGRPNVGKSSLLNRFLGEERAIVTPHPGTTRDIIDEKILIDGIPLRVVDMAGIRRTLDPIEQEGIRRAHSAIEQADLVLLVLDAGEALKEADHEIIASTGHKHRIIVLNKCDPGDGVRVEELTTSVPSVSLGPVVRVSALYNLGMEDLKKQLADYIRQHLWNDKELTNCLVTRVRHQEALKRVQQDLGEFLSAMNGLMPSDVQAFHLRSALDNLSEIIGTVTPDAILERIFSEFCIGK